jgi:phthiocerol/phenolphthiocerol synthesis type-I polyketide synthase E
MSGTEPTWDRAVAVIGLAGRFPGARNPKEFWHNLLAGEVSVRRLSPDELTAAGVAEAEFTADDYVPVRGVIDDAEFFDAELFGVPAREAEIMDPQHRILLTCAWEAMEDAGYAPRSAPGRVAVFAGCSPNSYVTRVLASADLVERLGMQSVMLANERDHLTTRIAYRLKMSGPAVTVATGCSTSLTAVHLAVQSLLGGDCDMALAGGVCITVPQQAGYVYSPHGILSPDGVTRTFDAMAAGTVPGNGAGLVLLKRAEAAFADGDNVLALIRGSAINNDGADRVGYAAPSATGQTAVIRAAHNRAGWQPDETDYFEAHGTATEIGDKIEIKALHATLGGSAARPRALGSLKPNIGHLDAAAGVAGLIKVTLALHHGVVPPNANCAAPDPKLDLDTSGLFIPRVGDEWPGPAGPRRAAVSSFGMGGTNAHVVLESAEPAPSPTRAARPPVVVISARTAAALDRSRAGLAAWLQQNPATDLADLAFTLQTGREVFPHRLAVVGDDIDELQEALRQAEPREIARRRTIVFAFPGQGTQHAGMAGGLYRGFERARAVIDECAELLKEPLGRDLRPLLLEDTPEHEAMLADTGLAQPAIFVTSIAIAEQLMEWGIRPAVMFGHSIGEYAAACVAGGVDLKEALTLVTARGRVMSEAPAGGMIGVRASAGEVSAVLGSEATIAVINGPRSVVVAGPLDRLDDWQDALSAAGLGAQRLNVSGAFHSPLMDPILPEFERALAAVRFKPLRAGMFTNLDGSFLGPDTLLHPEHWLRHLRQTVHFQTVVERLLQMPSPIVVEVGPGRSLGAFVRQIAAAATHPSNVACLATLGSVPAETSLTLARAMSGLWASGADIDWRRWSGGRRISLPTYPFERRRFWLDTGETPPPVVSVETAPASAKPVSGVLPDDDPVQTALVSLWRDVLGDDAAGPDDDFFELGGESLLAVKVIARVHKAFGVTLSMTDLWDSPTPRGVARRIGAMARTTSDGS